MNVLYIHTHDTGRYIQPYGYHVPTPRLMELAEEGTLFRHAYSAAPTCSPSRSALLTGMAPHACGMTGLVHRGFYLNDHKQHLAAYLKREGFQTVLCGVQHEASDPEQIGYQQILTDPDRNKSVFKDLSHAYLVADFLKQEQSRPFFLSFGLENTHREFPKVQETNPDYVMPPFPLYDHEQNRTDMARYMESIKIVDECVGVVMNALKESGHENDTLVIFTTDHGIAFPKMKCSLYDTGIGVSLMLKFPGNRRQGKAVDALVSQVDLFPTICDFLEIDHPSWLQGTSLLNFLHNETDHVREEIFAEINYHAAYEPMRCIRTKRYKLIKYYDEGEQQAVNIDDSLSKSFLIDHQYLEERREKEMLFDLYLDPVERVNLIHDVRYQEVYYQLSGRLTTWMEETSDPLLEDEKVPKPEGARVCE